MIHRAPFRLAALACLAVAVLLPTIVLGAPDPEKIEQFYEDTEILRRIFYDQKYEPIGSFDDLVRLDPKDVIVFFLGSSGIERIPGGLNHFVRHGGAVMIATSNPIKPSVRKEIQNLTGLDATIGPTLRYPQGMGTDQRCYDSKPHCPFVEPNHDLRSPFDKLFEKAGARNNFFERIATNEPSFLMLNGVWEAQSKELAYLPIGGRIVGGDNGPLPVKAGFALGAALENTRLQKNGPEIERGRLLLLANHRLFLNRMMLPRDTDNVEFAQNCLSFLEKRNNGERRRKLLFVQYGAIKTKFDIPLRELPELPDNLVEMVIDGLFQLGKGLPAIQDKLAEAEKRDALHGGLWRMLESKGIKGTQVMRWGLLAASGLFALYGLYRIGGPGRHRLDQATPLLPRVLAKHRPQEPLMERRRREMLDNDNLWEAARDRARLVLGAVGVPEPPPGSGVPTVQVRGSWWQRWRLRRRALRLWRLAFDPTPQLVPKTAWDVIDRELAELKAALARGDVRFVV